MKKLILFLLLTIQAFGCLCTGDIRAGFRQSSDHIANIVNKATSEINNNLVKEINKNTEDIKKQNIELEKLLKAYQEELAEKREILFLLEKIEKLQR